MSTPRRLYRSESDRIIAGVAGGVAQYFGIDATLLRVLWVALGLFSLGMPVILYAVMWVLVPRESRLDAAPADTAADAVQEFREQIRKVTGGKGPDSRASGS